MAEHTNVFTVHVPGFVEVDEDYQRIWPFSTVEELREIQIKRHALHGGQDGSFALSENRLLLVLRGGLEWWVLGYVKHPELLDVPAWQGGKYRARMADGTERILTKEVGSSCGDELRLIDGTTATWLRK